MSAAPDVEVLADIIAGAVNAATASLLVRIASLEAYLATKSAEVLVGPPGPAGRDADVEGLKAAIVAELGQAEVSREEIGSWVAAEVTKAMAAVQMPSDGKDADAEAVKLEVLADLKQALAQDVASLVGSEVTKAMSGIQIPQDGRAGANGKDADMDAVQSLISAEVVKAVAAVPAPKDGRSVELADLVPVIEAEVTKAMSTVPVPKDGAPGAQGEPGRSVELADVAPIILAEVVKTLEQWERPKDGVSVTVDDVAPLIVSEVTNAVSALPVPKDGVGLAGALVDRDGQLVVTLSDGTVKQLGSVLGRDVDMAEVTKQITDAVALFPRPKDGVDGFGFDDMDIDHDGERSFTFRWQKGERVKTKTYTIPAVIYRGVYNGAKEYENGDAVTWGGHMWVAHEKTSAKPGEASQASRAWVQAVKRGSEGKPGTNGSNGSNGRDGKDGKDRW